MKENLGALPHPKTVAHDRIPCLQLSISRVTEDHYSTTILAMGNHSLSCSLSQTDFYLLPFPLPL